MQATLSRPFRAECVGRSFPRALPWAGTCRPFRPPDRAHRSGAGGSPRRWATERSPGRPLGEHVRGHVRARRASSVVQPRQGRPGRSPGRPSGALGHAMCHNPESPVGAILLTEHGHTPRRENRPRSGAPPMWLCDVIPGFPRVTLGYGPDAPDGASIPACIRPRRFGRRKAFGSRTRTRTRTSDRDREAPTIPGRTRGVRHS